VTGKSHPSVSLFFFFLSSSSSSSSSYFHLAPVHYKRWLAGLVQSKANLKTRKGTILRSTVAPIKILIGSDNATLRYCVKTSSSASGIAGFTAQLDETEASQTATT
jgi:hypothetical protein